MNSVLIKEIDSRWECSSQIIKELLGEYWISDNLAPLSTWISNERMDKKVVLGVCGPGASGKTTFLNYICENCGFMRLINVTTRLPRGGESDGVDYHFVDLDTFRTYDAESKFEVAVEKSGRGFYGILKQDINKCLASSYNIAVIQSPLVLSQLFRMIAHNADSSDAQIASAILYFIPKQPIVSNLIEFLSQRQDCIDEKDVMIEHGWRQIEEFCSIASINREDIRVFVIEGHSPVQLGKSLEATLCDGV